LKWKALAREIKDEIVFDSPAIDELLNRITQDHYGLRTEVKRRRQEKENAHGSSDKAEA